MLLYTLVIASLTLLERKLLGLAQRRSGPIFVGYRGRTQYFADALKLMLKRNLVPAESNGFIFLGAPALACALCYMTWLNAA